MPKTFVRVHVVSGNDVRFYMIYKRSNVKNTIILMFYRRFRCDCWNRVKCKNNDHMLRHCINPHLKRPGYLASKMTK